MEMTLKKWVEDGEYYFVAEIVEYPGCMTDGETVKEAMRNMKEARLEWERVAREVGMEVREEESIERVRILPDYTEDEIQESEEAKNRLEYLAGLVKEKRKLKLL